MLSQSELMDINGRLQGGETPDEIAETLGVSRWTLLQRLLQSGKKISVVRRLVDTRPADDVPMPGQLVDARA